MTHDGHHARAALRPLRSALWPLAFCAAWLPVTAAALDLPRESRVPGGVAILDLGPSDEAPGSVVFNGYATPVLRTASGWVAVVGIPLDTRPGRVTARLQPAQGDPRDLEFAVDEKQYEEQRLTVANRSRCS